MHMTYILFPVLVRENLSSGIVSYFLMEAIIRILSGNQLKPLFFFSCTVISDQTLSYSNAPSYRLFFNFLRIRTKRKRFTH